MNIRKVDIMEEIGAISITMVDRLRKVKVWATRDYQYRYFVYKTYVNGELRRVEVIRRAKVNDLLNSPEVAHWDTVYQKFL